MKCKKCDSPVEDDTKQYCEKCYNFGAYLVAIYKEYKSGIISEEEANLLVKKANEDIE